MGSKEGGGRGRTRPVGALPPLSALLNLIITFRTRRCSGDLREQSGGGHLRSEGSHTHTAHSPVSVPASAAFYL